VSTNASATNRFSGTFVSSTNGTQPINATRWILNSSPTNSYIQHALDGMNANSFVRYYTADTALGQANPTDVRSGISYASGSLTGRLTVPARGSVALSVNYGPSMPFTATRSGTTATATLAYSYPLVVGDEFTVTGASNAEWNSTYTIASVVSGTSVTFTVPDTHSVTAGTGATMQTTGTAVLDPAAVASAVWGAASRTITGGLVDTATTLTNAPTVPSVVQIREEMDSSSTKLANLDASVSSRLASASYTAPANSDITAIKSKTDNLPSDPADQSLVESAISALSIPSVVQIRTEMDSNSTKLANLDATVSSRLAPSGTLATVTTLTNAPTVPSATDIATQVRTELATELARVDAAVSTRLASSAYSAAPTTAQIATAVEGSLLNEADGQAVLNAIVGAIGNTNLSEVSLVAAVRADLERVGGKIDSIPTTAAPTAAQNATAVWGTATKEITGGTVTTLTNSPDVPTEAEIASAVWGAATKEITGGTVTTLTNAPTSVTPSDIWSHATRTITGGTVDTLTNAPSVPSAASIRAEIDSNSTQLAAIKAKTDLLPASPAATGDIPSANISAIKAKTDLLETTRLAQCSTVATTGAQLAAALS
jgi:hypothetical protein